MTVDKLDMDIGKELSTAACSNESSIVAKSSRNDAGVGRSRIMTGGAELILVVIPFDGVELLAFAVAAELLLVVVGAVCSVVDVGDDELLEKLGEIIVDDVRKSVTCASKHPS